MARDFLRRYVSQHVLWVDLPNLHHILVKADLADTVAILAEGIGDARLRNLPDQPVRLTIFARALVDTVLGRYKPPDSVSLLRLAASHALVLVASLVNPAIKVLRLGRINQIEVLVDYFYVFFKLP